jgi:hypothetical protein
MLCTRCTLMLQCEIPEENLDASSLIAAAAAGCYICQRLLSKLQRVPGALEKWKSESYRFKVSLVNDCACIDIMQYQLWDEFPFGIILQLCITQESNQGRGVNHSLRNRNPSVRLSDGICAGRQWMEDCLSSHRHCQKNTQSTEYPTRLLELGKFGIRLISTAEQSPSGPYAALSYCWGPNPSFLCLEDSNLDALQTGIPYCDIPIAFQEAIDLIRGLSIGYVWIDCLCIIQSCPSSTKDWQFESGRMKDVYSNCAVNISLSQAASPYETCLRETTHYTVLPFEVEHSVVKGVVDNTWSGNVRCTYTIFGADYYSETLNNLPLGQRAWALQGQSTFHTKFLCFAIRVPNWVAKFPRRVRMVGKRTRPRCPALFQKLGKEHILIRQVRADSCP